MTEQLAQAGTQTRAFRLVAGPALAGASSVVVDLAPDDAWDEARAAMADAIDAVLGPGAAVIDQGQRPHITIAYGIGDGDSGRMQSALRRATGKRVTLAVDHLTLVRASQDPTAGHYRWISPTTIRLGTPRIT